MSSVKAYLRQEQKRVDKALRSYLPKASERPATLHRAMLYSMFAGGKRLRPILCLAAAEACGGDSEKAMPLACAVEVLHTYSLIHDDLPSMDDDDIRRGKPTCHKMFGDGVAVLAGDALQAFAFQLIALAEASRRYTHRELLNELALTAGSRMLIAGQVMDLEAEGRNANKAEVIAIHERKTAALLKTSLRLGAMSANANEEKLAAVTDFGHALGLAFQVIDDILDVTQTSEKLGKSAGKDQAAMKSTFPALMGLEASRKEAQRLTKQALASLDELGSKSQRLREIADHMLNRDY